MTDPTRFVLIGTSHAGNVGAAARAMKVMGFSDLVLVAPRHGEGVLCSEQAQAMASGALDVLHGARVVATLAEALADVSHACATAMTPRDFGPPTHAPRPYLASLARSAHRVAFVFGSERHGMSNEDVYRCHACLSIPTAPGYGSLNLAQAVQLMAYEWRQAMGGFEVAPRTPAVRHATQAAVDGALAHWREVLVRIGYLDPKLPRKLMPRLRLLLGRVEPSDDEVQILRGVARAVQAAIAAAPQRSDVPAPPAPSPAPPPAQHPPRRPRPPHEPAERHEPHEPRERHEPPRGGR